MTTLRSSTQKLPRRVDRSDLYCLSIVQSNLSYPTPVLSVSLCFPMLIFMPFWPFFTSYTLCNTTPYIFRHPTYSDTKFLTSFLTGFTVHGSFILASQGRREERSVSSPLASDDQTGAAFHKLISSLYLICLFSYCQRNIQKIIFQRLWTFP